MTRICQLFVNDNLNIFIPNIFSPNGDLTRSFSFYGYGLQESISFKIYNRWNKVVYQTDQYQLYYFQMELDGMVNLMEKTNQMAFIYGP